MWWFHVKFVLCVVLYTLALLLNFPVACMTGRLKENTSWSDIKSAYKSLQDDVYFGSNKE